MRTRRAQDAGQVWDKATIATGSLPRHRETQFNRRHEGGEPQALTLGTASRCRSRADATLTTSRGRLEIAVASDSRSRWHQPNFDIYLLPVDRSAGPRNITADNRPRNETSTAPLGGSAFTPGDPDFYATARA